jgi:hypothetical protein
MANSYKTNLPGHTDSFLIGGAPNACGHINYTGSTAACDAQ